MVDGNEKGKMKAGPMTALPNHFLENSNDVPNSTTSFVKFDRCKLVISN
jgi:hypothetical protein